MYYNPEKTIGGMFEADLYCLVAWLYSALMSLSGLSLFWWLDVKPGLALVTDFELILWVGLTIWGFRLPSFLLRPEKNGHVPP